MKSGRDFQAKSANFSSEDLLRKATKLEPIKKSGKTKRVIVNDEDEDEELLLYKGKKESVLDYYDDNDNDEESYDEESFDEDDYDEDDYYEEEDEEEDEDH